MITSCGRESLVLLVREGSLLQDLIDIFRMEREKRFLRAQTVCT
jgi:hypothetical protein